jgi:hypothetical protein
VGFQSDDGFVFHFAGKFNHRWTRMDTDF